MKRLLTGLSIFVLMSCSDGKDTTCFEWDCMQVRASAYNSLANQTDSNPFITAFGDSLKPGDRYIAVSRDLLRGPLKYNTEVSIEGLDGLFVVKDKMNSRYKNTIDLYMGLDIQAARNWGRQKLTICYKINVLSDSLN